MGLDMYLRAKRYVSHYDHKPEEKQLGEHVIALIGSAPGPLVYIEVEAAYWRKANHIHAWFVEHCQDGRDECQTEYVSRDALRELVTLCKTVLAQRELAVSALPTQSGFFFGSTDYDEYYFEDCEDTIKQLEPLLDERWSNWEFYYHSSW